MSVFIIAEAGVNHNGDLARACEMVEVAAACGADAIKFQTFRAESLVSSTARQAAYQVENSGIEESQFAMLKRLELAYDDFRTLKKHCDSKGITFLSTPFDEESLAFLVGELDMARIKLSSGDLTNARLILEAARTGKPMILSTGMAELQDIDNALAVSAFGYLGTDDDPGLARFQDAWQDQTGRQRVRGNVTVLQCTTEYPAPLETINLKVMDTLAEVFGVQTGLSDHSDGITVPVAAAARGAGLIEKHFTLSRDLPGPDHLASLEPDALKDMITAIRAVEKALGTGEKAPVAAELENARVARKSLVALTEIKAGEPFTEANLGIKRPGTGRSPLLFWQTLGSRAERAYAPDEVIEP